MQLTIRFTILWVLLALASFSQQQSPAPAPTPAPGPPTPTSTPAPAPPAPAPTPTQSTARPDYPAQPASTPGQPTGGPGGAGYGGASESGAYGYQYEDGYKSLLINPEHPIDHVSERQDGCIFDRSNLRLADITPVSINDFKPEPRDIFHLMDQVMTPVGAAKFELKPLQFDLSGNAPSSVKDQHAVYGRNTWILWCAGNEDFWDWLSQHAYGVLDFLHVVDSRQRGSRLTRMGLINQPGLKSSRIPGPWGLYFDTVDKQLGEEGDYSPFKDRPTYYPDSEPDPQGRTLKSDGVNPKVYGYPSGVIGLRIFPNPKFNDPAARKRWNPEAFYNDPAYAADPRTVRPYTVGMTCAICHVSAHPLNPPANPEEPQWSNLSSIIGAQYFRTSGSFGSRLHPGNFLWQYLASQQPGTIDTSMTATDQINNSNNMNPVFEMPARVQRALRNPTETQDDPARTLPGIGDNERRIARVLMDGADSIGIRAALLRVYLNIGLFHDEWNLTGNVIIGFTPQKPFTLDISRRNSIYWRVNEEFRMRYLEDFFTWEKTSPTELRTDPSQPRYQCSTQRMSLEHAQETDADGTQRPFLTFKDGQRVSEDKHWDEPAALRGSQIFIENCMICHSSKQPDGFHIEFAHNPPKGVEKWSDVPVDHEKLTLPYAYDNWGGEKGFTTSQAYKNYVARAAALANARNWDGVRSFFLTDNYLSTDLRIPVSLTQTNSARAVGTNALTGNVWEDYSSLTYRSLPPVGELTVSNAATGKEEKWSPPGNGPGYYRVPSLVSIWTCAPLLNNNGLGKYIPDTQLAHRLSVKGRMEMFDDAINKLFTKSLRSMSPSGEGGLRGPTDAAWYPGSDKGWIYRTDMETEFRIPSGHLRSLVLGVLPGMIPPWAANAVVKILDNPEILPLVLILLSLALLRWSPRGFLYLIALTGLIALAVLAVTGIHHLLPGVIWLVPLILVVGALAWMVTKPYEKQDSPVERKQADSHVPSFEEEERVRREAAGNRRVRIALNVARWGGVVAFALVLLSLFPLLWAGREFVNGNVGDLRVGPFPKGVPVNAIMNMDPAKPLYTRLAAVRGLCKMLGKLQAENAKERKSDEERRRYLLKHPSATENQLPPLYRFSEDERLQVFNECAGPALIRASKCPDFVIDRGHYFGETLDEKQKQDLIAFLKTL